MRRRAALERGQATVELVGVLPLVVVLGFAVWQAAVAGQALWMAGAGGRAPARAGGGGGHPAGGGGGGSGPTRRRPRAGCCRRGWRTACGCARATTAGCG